MLRIQKCSAVLAVMIGTASFSHSPAKSQGILMPIEDSRPSPFVVKSVQLNASIQDGIAQTTVKQIFVNNANTDKEGTYLFPLPEGATVTSFTLTAGDRALEGRMLSREEARGTYESIVRRRRDPALLEYIGHGLFKASVFPIPAHGERLLTLKYAEVLKPEGSLHKFVYPLSTGRYSTSPVSATSITVSIHAKAAIKTVYSLTHDVSIRRTDETDATASYESHNQFPDRDFTLYYGTTNDEIGLNVLTQPTGSDGGYFMLIASPRVSIPRERVMAKQIVFVLDRTGSMQDNNKMEQAKGAIKFCLNSLNPNDRFDVITFNESPDVFSNDLLPSSRENIEKAQKFVRNVDASGGTNIDAALQSALKILDKSEGRQKMVVFLTDGLPTVGETNIDTILQHVKQQNVANGLVSSRTLPVKTNSSARIFCFGVGYDVNVPFLDRLAEQNRAEADYVRPNENVEGIVSTFYGKIASPALVNIDVQYPGGEVYDVYPKQIPDLFKGGQLVITGKYRGTGGSIKLTGFSQDQLHTFQVGDAFGENAARTDMVSRIWATRKIGFLLDEVRLHSNREVIDEIVRLSKTYGIITPYTSFLADETNIARVTNLGSRVEYALPQLSEARAPLALNYLSDRSKYDVGASATGRALNSRGYQNAGQAPSAAQGGFGSGGLGGGRGGKDLFDSLSASKRSELGVQFGDANSISAKAMNSQTSNRSGYQQVSDNASVQNVSGHTFYKRSGIWFDNNYPASQKVILVKSLSDAHFQLIKLHPEIAKYSSVGDEVVVTFGSVSVQIGKTGTEKLTDVEIKEIK